jgi:hypothetical protein
VVFELSSQKLLAAGLPCAMRSIGSFMCQRFGLPT